MQKVPFSTQPSTQTQSQLPMVFSQYAFTSHTQFPRSHSSTSENGRFRIQTTTYLRRYIAIGLAITLPVQLSTPSPEQPGLHTQVKFPMVSQQSAFSWQLSVPSTHSFTSAWKELSPILNSAPYLCYYNPRLTQGCMLCATSILKADASNLPHHLPPSLIKGHQISLGLMKRSKESAYSCRRCRSQESRPHRHSRSCLWCSHSMHSHHTRSSQDHIHQYLGMEDSEFKQLHT